MTKGKATASFMSPTRTFGMCHIAESRTGLWWEIFFAIKAFIAEHNGRPSSSHAVFGEWITSVNESLRLRQRQHHDWEGKGPLALTPDRCLALSEINYEDLPTISSVSPVKKGLVSHVFDLLTLGQPIAEADYRKLYQKYRGGILSSGTVKRLKTYGIAFPN